jgi:predicted nucleic acid-binding protein
MTFADLTAGDHVFVDANIFTYHFQPHPKFGIASRLLLERIENAELTGYTSTHVLSEVSHRLMTIEASTLFGWPFAGIGNRLRTSPAEVQKLNGFRVAIEGLVQSRFQILSVSPAMLVAGVALSQQLGLLTNDALIVAVMQANGLMNLASGDSDFDKVPGLTRFAPM